LNHTPLVLLLGRPSCGFCRSPHRSGLGGPPCCLFGSGLTGSFLRDSLTRSLLRSSPTRGLLRSNSARGLLGLDPRCLLRFGLQCSLLLAELRAPFRLLGVDRVALREDLPLVRQALESTPRFASPVHVVDGVSPRPARLYSPKGVICLCGGEDLHPVRPCTAGLRAGDRSTLLVHALPLLGV